MTSNGNFELSQRVKKHKAFALENLLRNIYNQAILEDVKTTFKQTEEILQTGTTTNITDIDIQKILNLKNAWLFILEDNVLSCPSDYYLLCQIASLVNAGLLYNGGKIRKVPVKISGSSYIPPIPSEWDVSEKLYEIASSKEEAIDIAINLCLYCMRSQLFEDGNKRVSVIFANHYLLTHGEGTFTIPSLDVPHFRNLLVEYYESNDSKTISTFIKEKGWKK